MAAVRSAAMSDFKMTPAPGLMSDTGIHRLYDGDGCVARTFDLRFEYTSFAPEHSRWSCIDLNTYDGAPDAQAPCTFIGRGASEKQAKTDLLEQFAEYDVLPEQPLDAAAREVESAIDDELDRGVGK